MNGVRDLLDFYPVALDIKPHLKVFPKEEYSYRISLVHPDGETPAPVGKFMYTEQTITPMSYDQPEPDTNRSGHYHTNIPLARTLVERTLYSFNNSIQGSELQDTFLEHIETDGSGVILIEHDHCTDLDHASACPAVLKLEIVHPLHGLMAEGELQLSLSGVEKMFTHKDLRGEVITQPGAEAPVDWSGPWNRYTGSDEEPSNYPDDLTSDAAFVSVHGYNNNLRASRGGNAEMFKRMHVLGSQAKFVAVSWYGYQSQQEWNNWFVQWGWYCLDYQINVVNAFATAEPFKNYVSTISKDRIVVGAHSLGNMVVSAAIQDFGLDVNQYFMFNAAVSSEAYSTVAEPVNPDMVHREWGIEANAGGGVNLFPEDDPDYLMQCEHLFAYNWYKLFDAETDSRATLTWNGRLNNVRTKAYNFWSAGDRTFHAHPHADNPDSKLGNLEFTWESGPGIPMSWSLQEKLKGRGGTGSYGVGGWGFNSYYALPWGVFAPWAWLDNPSLIPGKPSTQLIEKPYFRIGDAPNGNVEMYANLFDPEETDSATDYMFNSTLLATFIPSKQLAAGGIDQLAGLPSSGENQRSFEMQASFGNGAWHNGYNVDQQNPMYWDHGDFKKIGLPYVSPLYQFFIQEGGLD